MRYGVLAVILFLPGCSRQNRDADIKAIAKLETEWMKDIRAKDLERWVDHYAEDGSMLWPNSPVVTGRDNIRASIKGRIKDPHYALVWQPEKIQTSDRLAYVRGRYMLTRTDRRTQEPVTDQGKYVTVYRKEEDGEWKVIEDIGNSDMPRPIEELLNDSSRKRFRERPLPSHAVPPVD
jgi:uncharacterized protein (TIGR02246 family)